MKKAFQLSVAIFFIFYISVWCITLSKLNNFVEKNLHFLNDEFIISANPIYFSAHIKDNSSKLGLKQIRFNLFTRKIEIGFIDFNSDNLPSNLFEKNFYFKKFKIVTNLKFSTFLKYLIANSNYIANFNIFFKSTDDYKLSILLKKFENLNFNNELKLDISLDKTDDYDNLYDLLSNIPNNLSISGSIYSNNASSNFSPILVQKSNFAINPILQELPFDFTINLQKNIENDCRFNFIELMNNISTESLLSNLNGHIFSFKSTTQTILGDIKNDLLIINNSGTIEISNSFDLLLNEFSKYIVDNLKSLENKKFILDKIDSYIFLESEFVEKDKQENLRNFAKYLTEYLSKINFQNLDYDENNNFQNLLLYLKFDKNIFSEFTFEAAGNLIFKIDAVKLENQLNGKFIASSNDLSKIISIILLSKLYIHSIDEYIKFKSLKLFGDKFYQKANFLAIFLATQANYYDDSSNRYIFEYNIDSLLPFKMKFGKINLDDKSLNILKTLFFDDKSYRN